MRVKTPNYERELEMEIWTRGLEDTLVRIRSPRKERGTSTLKKGREMWNYLPKIKKTIRIPPSLMLSSWMGSDFTNDDMVRESSWQKDYTAGIADGSPPGQICLDFRARSEAVVAWDRVVACVDEKTYVPIRQTFYDDKGRKARAIEFSDVRNFGGRPVPSRLTLTPLTADKRGHQTVVVYDSLEFDEPLPEDIFSLTHLRRGR
jgi:outer membrane lipoprotein-sorting protein